MAMVGLAVVTGNVVAQAGATVPKVDTASRTQTEGTGAASTAVPLAAAAAGLAAPTAAAVVRTETHLPFVTACSLCLVTVCHQRVHTTTVIHNPR